MLFWYEKGLKGEVLYSFVDSKGKMAISYLEKYGQILYQKIALRVWVPTQQTVCDFKFSSPSYVHFTKMCLAGREALNMSSVLRVESFFCGFGQMGIGHVERGISTCRGGPKDTPLTLFSHIKHH